MLIGLHEAVQAFVIFITIGLFIFFVVEYLRGRATWEILWVSFVEATVYLLATLLPSTYVPVFGPEGLPMIRYMSWMLTCPVLIKVMISSVSISPDLSRNNKMVIADILMNSFGVFACLYSDLVVKITLFIAGMFVAGYIIHGIFAEYLAAKHLMDQPRERGTLLVLMLVSWSIFPVLFLLGPEVSGVMANELSVTFHSFGDLFAKNFYSFFAWRIKIRSENKKAKLAKEAALDEVKLGVPGNDNKEIFESRHSRNNRPSQNSMQGGSGQVLMTRMQEEMSKLEQMKDDMQANMDKLASVSPRHSPRQMR